MSTKQTLGRITERAEYAYTIKEVLLAAFLDIDGAFDNTSLELIV